MEMGGKCFLGLFPVSDSDVNSGTLKKYVEEKEVILKMNIKIIRTRLEEVEILLEIQKEAFQPDLELYQDFDSNPAVEPIDRLKLKVERYYYYTIFIDGKIVGGIDIRPLEENHYRLNRIFLHPNFQDKGYGSKIIKIIEDEFPFAKKWSLDTPFKNFRNHHFYEKLGYRKVGEHKVTEKLTLFDYEKVL